MEYKITTCFNEKLYNHGVLISTPLDNRERAIIVNLDFVALADPLLIANEIQEIVRKYAI